MYKEWWLCKSVCHWELKLSCGAPSIDYYIAIWIKLIEHSLDKVLDGSNMAKELITLGSRSATMLWLLWSSSDRSQSLGGFWWWARVTESGFPVFLIFRILFSQMYFYSALSTTGILNVGTLSVDVVVWRGCLVYQCWLSLARRFYPFSYQSYIHKYGSQYNYLWQDHMSCICGIPGIQIHSS